MSTSFLAFRINMKEIHILPQTYTGTYGRCLSLCHLAAFVRFAQEIKPDVKIHIDVVESAQPASDLKFLETHDLITYCIDPEHTGC